MASMSTSFMNLWELSTQPSISSQANSGKSRRAEPEVGGKFWKRSRSSSFDKFF